jgi:hypothetical protein
VTRPRGFIDYQPQAKAAELISEVRSVIDEYEDILPITLRQLFYILVTRSILDKTERAYKNDLCEVMNKARRGNLVSMDTFRDDGFTHHAAPGWENKQHLVTAWRNTAKNFTLDRQTNQERRITIWCEAGGMVPQLERVAHKYSVPVVSSGGFDSLTTKHEQGRLLGDGATVLHIGDHDPSGVHIFGSLNEDIRSFANSYGNDVEFTRLAVTPDQVDEYNLPTSPPKTTDNRAFTGMTTQAEALDPRTLASIVEEAITQRLDMDLYNEVVSSEGIYREELIQMIGERS